MAMPAQMGMAGSVKRPSSSAISGRSLDLGHVPKTLSMCWGPHVSGWVMAMPAQMGMAGSVKRPSSSATSGRISAMCRMAPMKPHLYT